jgi:hypothetical protein
MDILIDEHKSPGIMHQASDSHMRTWLTPRFTSFFEQEQTVVIASSVDMSHPESGKHTMTIPKTGFQSSHTLESKTHHSVIFTKDIIERRHLIHVR